MNAPTRAARPGQLLTLTKANAEALLGQERLVVVDFWAAWCGPCRQFAPVFAHAAATFPEVTFAKCDTEAQEALAARFEIRSIPTLMAFRAGKAVQRTSGAMAAPALEQFIERAASVNPRWVSTDASPWACLDRAATSSSGGADEEAAEDEDQNEDERAPASAFTSLGTLAGAIRRSQHRELAQALNGHEADHGALLSQLAPAYLWLLVHGSQALSTLTANAGQHLVARAAFAPAMVLYDAVVESDMDPQVAANPLYAVQDDNHHLGVNIARARRYLERCLPHAPANPAIWLNAACVQMELKDHEGALESLRLAHKHGFDVGPSLGEPLFTPLKDDARFLELKKRAAPRRR